MKKLIMITLILALFMNTHVFAQSTITEVTGTIQASVIDVDIPTIASFTINPNGPTFTSPDLLVSNNSTMPVVLSISKFDNKVGSTNQFTEVGPNEKVWEHLGINESRKFIYLGIGAKNPYEEGFIINREWLNDVSAHEIQQGTVECAAVAPGRSVTLNFEGKYGRAFQETFTTTYELMFLVSMME